MENGLNIARYNMTEYEKLHNCLIYDALDDEIGAEQKRSHRLCERYNSLGVEDDKQKQEILKELFIDDDFGDFRIMEKPMFIDNGKEITIGRNFYSNIDFSYIGGAPVKIGDNVFIGPHCTLATGIHSLIASERRLSKDESGNFHDFEYGKPITIGNDVWIASSVTICAGVTIGDGSVIGAGSVVTRDIPSGVIAFGNPCTVQRKITEEDSMYLKFKKNK